MPLTYANEMDLLPETWRRMRAESQRMMARLIEQCRASCQSARKYKDGLYEFNIAHLPGEVLKKFGDVMIVRNSEAVDLNYWTLSELHSLHQELEKGTVRVKTRDERSSSQSRLLHEELSHSQRQLQGSTIQIDIRDGSPRPLEKDAIRATPPVKLTRKSKGNACTNCKAQKTRCVGKLPCLRCVEKNCAATCTYPGSSSLEDQEVDEYLTIQRSPNVLTAVEQVLPELHLSRQELEEGIVQQRTRIGSKPTSRSATVYNAKRLELQKELQRRLNELLAAFLGDTRMCKLFTMAQVLRQHPHMGQRSRVSRKDYEMLSWKWQFHPDCPYRSFPDAQFWNWRIDAYQGIESALDANQISVTNVHAPDRQIVATPVQIAATPVQSEVFPGNHQELEGGIFRINELNQQNQEPHPRSQTDKSLTEAQHKVLDRLKDRLATLLGESCEDMSADRVLGRAKGSTPWRWQLHMDCRFNSFPEPQFSRWSLDDCRKVENALDLKHISVTLAKINGPGAPSQLPLESSFEVPQAGNTIVPNCHPDSMDSFTDDNTGFGAIDPSLLLEQSHEQPEDLIPAAFCKSHAAEISSLEQKVRDAETVASSKILQVSHLENDLCATRSQAIRYLTDLSVAKAEITSAHIQIQNLKSKLETPAKDSVAQIKTLQSRVDDANETSRKLHVWLANGNTAQQTELKEAKDYASAQSAKVSDLETQLKDTRTLLQDSENLLQLANARTNAELGPSLLELKNVKSELAEQIHVSTNFKEKLRASEKECELRVIMMDKLYAQQKTDRQTIENLQQAEKDLKVQLASLQKTSLKTIADLQQAANDSKVEFDSQQKTSQKTIRDLQEAQRDLKKLSVSEERKSRKVVKDLEQALEELKIQLAASEETAAGHLRDAEIQMENVKKAEGIQRRLEKQAAVAKASGVSAGKRSALSVMEKQQTIMLQAHSKQLEEARYEAIEIGRASALEESKVGLDQARIDALVSIHKSWDGIPPDLLPNPGDLSTKAIALLEVLSGKTDSLTAYKLLREAIQQRYKSTAASDKSSFVTSQDVQSVLARHSFAPASRKNVNMPSPRSNSSAKSSVRPTVETEVPVFSNRSRSCSTEIDDDELRALIVQQMLSDFARPPSLKRPAPANKNLVVRPPKRPIPICVDSDDDCTIINKPASPKRPLTNTDSVERSPKRLKSITLGEDSDDECTIVVDVSRLEHEKERRLREEKLMELSHRRRKCRKQKSKPTSSSAPKSRSKSKKHKERP